MPAIGWYNGTMGPLSEMTVPMNDRAVYFGDGCYEACLATGLRAFALEAHLDRFERSLKALSIPFRMDRESLVRTLTDCLAAADEPCAALYWQVSRATAQRMHAFPAGEAKPNLLIMVTPKTRSASGMPMKLITAEDVRYAMCDVKTLNLIPSILAIQKAKDAGADEAVLHRDGVVTEGSHTNIHILRDGVLYTHPKDRHILSGVTRGVLLEICRALSVPVSETAFSVSELAQADEVLITSSLLGVRRACELDGAPVGGRADALYRAIVEAYRIRFTEETGA
jgi:D-alanine transaminase